jgi:hypothetical protein
VRMANTERIREIVSKWPDRDAWKARMDEGWRPVAIEWERDAERQATESGQFKHEVPYGLKVSQDCRHLERDAQEMTVLKLILALIAGDHPLSKIAEQLNRQGHRMRNGAEWTQVSVFHMLPRLIEVAPEILSTEEWTSSKKRILRAV